MAQIERRFEYRLAPITVVRGSRQVGKTTACMYVIVDLSAKGVVPMHIMRVQWDIENSPHWSMDVSFVVE